MYCHKSFKNVTVFFKSDDLLPDVLLRFWPGLINDITPFINELLKKIVKFYVHLKFCAKKWLGGDCQHS